MAKFVIKIDLTDAKMAGYPVDSVEVPTSAETLQQAEEKAQRIAERLASYQQKAPVPSFTVREVS